MAEQREAPPPSRRDAPASYPCIPLRDVVVLPGMEPKLSIGRATSVAALQQSLKRRDRSVVLVAQREPRTNDPRREDLYEYGCLARIIDYEHFDGVEGPATYGIQVEGRARVKIEAAEGSMCRCRPCPDEGLARRREIESLVAELRKLLPSRRIEAPPPAAASRWADRIAARAEMGIPATQAFLETLDLPQRLRLLIDHYTEEQDLDERARALLEKTSYDREQHKQDYLRRKAVDIQRNMGEETAAEIDGLVRRIEEAGMTPEAHAKCVEEVTRLGTIPAMSPEGSTIRSYLDFMLALPWRARSEENTDFKQARATLDERHYGLGVVKERVLEHIAVQQQAGEGRGSVLCFIGPPGVGKTSLGEVIARALGRKFARVSLGGVHDESTLRGHRRTYVGSMPGRLLKAMTDVGVRNPVIMLDEIEKLGLGVHGDPMATLLEIIDPEQNRHFSDHYIEVDFDLSEVMFIATANAQDTMYQALEDRMEFIRLPGYVDGEKIEIARRHLLPKQLAANGLEGCKLKLSDATLEELICNHTQEAGVRQLERCLAQLLRHEVLEHERGGGARPPARLAIDSKRARAILDPPSLPPPLHGEDRSGIINSLAVQADLFGIVSQLDGVAIAGDKGVRKTGSLGDMLEQSVDTAAAVLRAGLPKYGLPADYLDTHGIHIHWPDVDIGGEGNSAGLALFTLLVSIANDIPARMDTAMTGALNLRGEACIVGGLREKLMGASRRGLKRVLFPAIQQPELRDMPQEILDRLELIPVKHVDEVLKHALTRMPRPWRKPAGSATSAPPPPRDDAPAQQQH